ncbi:hypothetical protein [Paenibacillus wynnii]|uniref:hypothetical protein n=1 Tax=Paenibacillus wynnii TaxID=268407 RepID=UPI00278E368F|nr:hypothetical protein [Paenibacillus wynnii]MDQ0195054.1 hypothetical protein [Paenibacillus wynnii]
MSKDRVWNKGKHNGRGLAGVNKKPGSSIESSDPEAIEAELVDSNAGNTGNPIHSVQRMNRENWVVRPSRVIPKKTNKDPNES